MSNDSMATGTERGSEKKTVAPGLETYPPGFIKMMTRFLSASVFGDHRFLKEGEKPSKTDVGYELGNTPPYVIHQEDLKAISEMHRNMIARLPSVDIPEDAEKIHEMPEFVMMMGWLAMCKVILLIQYLVISYNYYNVASVPYPGRSASSYLNPMVVPDLKDALILTGVCLVWSDRDKNAYVKTRALSDLYTVMKILFDLLNGMLPCDEVAELRNRYHVFHMSKVDNGELEAFLEQLVKVSNRFAQEEPKWERAKPNSPYTDPIPGPDVPIKEMAAVGKNLPQKPKSGRRGSGLKGSKTEMMQAQLSRFTHFIDHGHSIDEREPGKNVEARAASFWAANKNSFERAARAKGKKRGYKNSKCLACAYRNR